MSRFFAPLALALLVAAVVALVATASRTANTHANSAAHQRAPKGPPYWTVRPGDTLTEISIKTHLPIAQLEAYNPNADPQNLVPGERLNLWAHPPRPQHHPKPLGPRFWTVRPGQSFGSIAAKTQINIIKLEQLNPRLKPSSLQPGNRVRLRP